MIYELFSLSRLSPSHMPGIVHQLAAQPKLSLAVNDSLFTTIQPLGDVLNAEALIVQVSQPLVFRRCPLSIHEMFDSDSRLR